MSFEKKATRKSQDKVAPSAADMDKKNATAGKLISTETKAEGAVGWDVYKSYMNAAGGWLVLATLILLLALSQISRVACDYWLTYWTSQVDSPDEPSLPGGKHGIGFFMGIYALMSLGWSVITLLQAILLAVKGVQAGKNLHNRAFQSIMRSPMSFFDVSLDH